MGNLITKDGVNVNIGLDMEDMIKLGVVLLAAGVLAAVISGAILKAI